MTMHAAISQAHQLKSLDPLIQNIPYANLLGIKASLIKDEILFHLPSSQAHIGNPTLPAMHGGVVGGFMEISAALHLMYSMEVQAAPKVINFSIEYLRAGFLVDTYARCQIVRLGRKVAHISATCWQADENKPIATSRTHFLLK